LLPALSVIAGAKRDKTPKWERWVTDWELLKRVAVLTAAASSAIFIAIQCLPPTWGGEEQKQRKVLLTKILNSTVRRAELDSSITTSTTDRHDAELLLKLNSLAGGGDLKPPTRRDLPVYSMDEVKKHGRNADRVWVTYQQVGWRGLDEFTMPDRM
jgi:hypothetical protein